MWKILFAILSVVTVFISPDCGGNHDIKISDSWAVMAPADNNAPPTDPTADANNGSAYVYMVIANNAKEVDTLAGISSAVAQTAELVQPVMIDGGTAQPQPVPNVQIKPDREIALRPGKICIRLSGLKQPLVEGASFQLTLSFQNAGEIKQSVLIEKPGSTKFDE